MSNEYTKGEWRIGDGGWSIFGPPNGKPAPAVIATMDQGASMGPLERRGNARLIAAAPDLLSACQEILQAVNAMPREYRHFIMNSIDKTRSAITKATGG